MEFDKVYVESSKFCLEAVVGLDLLLADRTLDLTTIAVLMNDAVVCII